MTSITYTQGQTTIGNLTYTYDANGRRTSMGGSLAHVNLPAAISSTTYNANNQLTNWNGTTLTYDLNGNLSNDGATSYTWDARNRLSAFGSTPFAYDTFGRRTRNATGTAFLYDGVNPVQELSGGNVTANLLTGLGVDEVFTRTDSAGVRDYLTDALGSTLALTDSSGATQTQYTYEPFGKTTSSGATNTSTFQYTGRENDGTGLYYYRARYYHPTLQRFVSEDPARLSGGDVNFYAYVTENPTLLTDPLGEAGITSWGPDPFGPMLPDPPRSLAPRKPPPEPPEPPGPPEPPPPPLQPTRPKPPWPTCLFSPHDFVQTFYGGKQPPSDPLLGNGNATPWQPAPTNKGFYPATDPGLQELGAGWAAIINLGSNTFADCALRWSN